MFEFLSVEGATDGLGEDSGASTTGKPTWHREQTTCNKKKDGQRENMHTHIGKIEINPPPQAQLEEPTPAQPRRHVQAMSQ
jgi:hypothetical protein